MNPAARALRLSYQVIKDPWTNLKRKYLPFPELNQSIDINLKHAIMWLHMTHKVTNYRGSAAAFRYSKGWEPAYPETTGYIAKSLFEYSDFSSQKKYFDEAIAMCDWLIEIQKKDGGINEGSIKDRSRKPSVIFNTGMVMLGWIEAYKRTNDMKYMKALTKAGDFLEEIRKDDRLWLKHCYQNILHTYHSRVAWAILELHSLSQKQGYLDTALDIYSWVLSQQKENGYFENCCFEKDYRTCNTHGIAYTLRGLLEGYKILHDNRYLESVIKTSEVLMRKFEIKKFLQTSYNEKWKPIVDTECLTGIAQHSFIWFKIYELTDDIRYLNAGLDATDLLCYLQNINSRSKDIRGAISGSHPIWGIYAPFQYPNWATKFFVDALMLRLKITKDLEERLP